MTSDLSPLESRLRVCGILVFLGLVIDAISLWWSHPTAFLVFVFIGGSFVLLGILLYLYSLVALPAQPP